MKVNKQETEAVIPLAYVWVAINVIPALVVGAVMWFKDDNGEDSPKKISALNAGTGEVTLEDMSDSVWWNAGTLSEFKTWTNASGTKLYPVTDAMVTALEAGGVLNGLGRGYVFQILSAVIHSRCCQ